VIKEVKNLLSSNFEMKDLGEADVILNIKLVREGDGGVTLLQSHTRALDFIPRHKQRDQILSQVRNHSKQISD
jgi:hypothetical protein